MFSNLYHMSSAAELKQESCSKHETVKGNKRLRYVIK